MAGARDHPSRDAERPSGRLAAIRRNPRRALVMAGVVAALLFVLATLWLLSVELPAGPLGLTKLRIRYGLFGWYVVDTGMIDRPPSRPWPWTRGWAGRLSWPGLMATLAATCVAPLAAAWIACQVDRRLAPRTHCRSCGQRLRGGFGDSPVCPECGELPHRRR